MEFNFVAEAQGGKSASTAMVDRQSFTKSCDWRTKTDGTPGPRSAEAQGTVARSRWQPRAKSAWRERKGDPSPETLGTKPRRLGCVFLEAENAPSWNLPWLLLVLLVLLLLLPSLALPSGLLAFHW